MVDGGDGLTGDERRALSGEFVAGQRPVVRAEVLRAWCLDGAVNLRAAVVVGPLDLSAVRLNSVLRLRDCEFADPLDLTGARFGEEVHLTGCVLVGLAADRLSVAGDLVLNGSRSTGVVSFVDGRVGGSLSAAGTAPMGWP
jgi:hypothetical protein